MSRVTEFEVVDEAGNLVPADPHGNNVALACLECDGPVLAIARPDQRGSSLENPSECPACGTLTWVRVLESEARMVVHLVPVGRVLLHDEVVEILEASNRPMSTKEIANEVNRRARYVKKDRSTITPYQIHGRTRKYDALFAREGQMVGLVRWALEGSRR